MNEHNLAILFLRSDVDWSMLNEQNFINQDVICPTAYPTTLNQRKSLLKGISIWNSVFGMSYFDYRLRLKEISNQNWCQINNLDLVFKNHNHYPTLIQWPNSVVIPVDEDDWFHPDIINKLKSLNGSSKGLIQWNDAAFRPVPQLYDAQDLLEKRPRIRLRPSPQDVPTNAYAVLTDYLSKLSPVDGKSCVMEHWNVSKHFPEGKLRLHQYLGVTHKSLASWSNIKAVTSPKFLINQVHNLSTQTEALPDELAWVKEYIRLSDILNIELRNSINHSYKSKLLRQENIEAEQSTFQDVINLKNSIKPKSCCNHQTILSKLSHPISKTNLINAIIEDQSYHSYLEIGCEKNLNFDQITAQHKVGVDPERGGTLRLSSDSFFQINQELFDIIFIDGLHLKEQVMKDVENALNALADDGTIILHDCLPRKKFQQFRKPHPKKGAWTGDTWKAVVELRTRSNIDIAVLDSDWGLGVIRKKKNTQQLSSIPAILSWDTYTKKRNELLRVLSLKDLAGLFS